MYTIKECVSASNNGMPLVGSKMNPDPRELIQWMKVQVVGMAET